MSNYNWKDGHYPVGTKGIFQDKPGSSWKTEGVLKDSDGDFFQGGQYVDMDGNGYAYFEPLDKNIKPVSIKEDKKEYTISEIEKMIGVSNIKIKKG